jgi:hypothetical protein
MAIDLLLASGCFSETPSPDYSRFHSSSKPLRLRATGLDIDSSSCSNRSSRSNPLLFPPPRPRGRRDFGVFRAMSDRLNGLNSLNDLNRFGAGFPRGSLSVTVCHAFPSYRE